MSLNQVEPARRSFIFRLNLWYAAFFVAASCALFAVAYLVLANQVRTRDATVIQAKLEECGAWYAAGGLSLVKKRILDNRNPDQHAFMLRLVGQGGQELLLSIPPGWEGFDIEALKAAIRRGDPSWLPANDRKTEWIFARAEIGHNLWLEVGKSRENPEEVLAPFRIVFGLMMAGVMLIGFAGGGWLTYRAFNPVRQVIKTARNIIETGQMNARVRVKHTGDELDELVNLFNRMLEKNEALIRGMREALDNVAHDLRTPMARLRGTAEMALQTAGENPEACREALADSMEESERVLTMLKTLMDVSEAETGTMKLNVEKFDLAPLVRDILDLYQIVAEEKRIALSAQAAEGLSIEADRIRIQQVLANLVDNAIKYTAVEGRVEVAAFREADYVIIRVLDNGMGIPPEELPRIWERLYRGDKSRSQKGLGLGLCLVKAVVQAHGGRVEVASQPQAGSVFTVRLPATRESAAKF
jgi:signal transduction histidine kinase